MRSGRSGEDGADTRSEATRDTGTEGAGMDAGAERRVRRTRRQDAEAETGEAARDRVQGSRDVETDDATSQGSRQDDR
jgi:hypothetical protein